MRRLEENSQPLQAGNQVMIKMVQRANRRIKVKKKSHKMNRLSQIHSNKLVSIKLCFSISIQGVFSFSCKISGLMQIVLDLNLVGNIKIIFRFTCYQVVEV